MRNLIVSLVILFSSISAFAKDPMFAEDKYMHFGVSAAMSAGCTAFNSRPNRELECFAGSVAVGIAKEIHDHNVPGKIFSYKDLIWDIAGAYTGAKFGGWIFTPNQVGYTSKF